MSKADQSLPATRFSFRLDFTPGGRLGPGKVQLLEAIGETGSISAAGRSMKMSYRRAWLLVDDLNRIFRMPLVEAQPGGAKGGGAHLTALGREIVANYRAIEAKALEAGAAEIAALRAAVSPTAPVRDPGEKA
ncbi:MAG: LysR family transcriptional regulator [Bosea sp.]|uniref:winged helix-turn-helix domain-containing protein n=1 Tax=Bosea sp. (in: a-proteobacteria) TaxID=1871050 RepID=UPI002392D2FF|nr:LysR family transcriptional regulator [Bosea sp. (in: a-proteobacteria)]MCP4736045.1 LysR family transcriptional regulator [Bosea sp. (in: a-proteobacteria)]